MAEKDALLRERELLCAAAPLPAVRCERATQAQAGRGRRSYSEGVLGTPLGAAPTLMATGTFQTAYQKLRSRATELVVSVPHSRCSAAVSGIRSCAVELLSWW